MIFYATALVLIGTIVSTKTSLATFQTAERGKPVDSDLYGTGDAPLVLDRNSHWFVSGSSTATVEHEAPPTVTVEEGQTVQGWTVDRIEPHIVYVHQGKIRCRLDVGDSPGDEVALRPPVGIERSGDEVLVSTAVRDEVSSGSGLLHVLMDAAATPMAGGGYMITLIEPGSVFDRIGLKDGDTVTEIDDTVLTDPWTAVQALRRVSGQDRFTVKVRTRAGSGYMLTVRIR